MDFYNQTKEILLRMKIRRLWSYIAKYDGIETAGYAMIVLSENMPTMCSIHKEVNFIYRTLKVICGKRVAKKVVKRFIRHEQKKNRMCVGCMNEEPNQLAHVDYGGCLS